MSDLSQIASAAPNTAQVLTTWVDSKMTEFGAAVQQAVSKYGPKALDLVLTYARADALVEVVTPILIAVLAAIIALVTSRIFVRSRKHTEELDDYETWSGAMTVISAIVCGISTVVCIVNLFHARNLWAWIGLWHPELYLAHQGIEAIRNAAQAWSNH